MKKNILIITGTRADYGLLKPVIEAMQKSKKLIPKLLVTGMHTLRKFGNTIDEIKKDKIPVSCIIKISKNDDMLMALSKEIIGIKKFCEKNKPDLILILGDRDEPLAAAIVGSHLGIPIAHIHGGDISGSCNVDELNRHAITKLSHLHFSATQKSYWRVIRLGENPSRVFNVGSPAIDNLKNIKYLDKKELAKRFNLDLNKKWFIVVQHPVPLEKISIKQQIRPTLLTVSRFDSEKIILYPNSDTGSNFIINEISKYKNKKHYHVFKNLDRITYLSLLKHSNVIIGNSSSGIIESGYFRLPAVDVGNRQKRRECSQNVIHTNYNEKKIKKAIDLVLSEKFKRICTKLKSPYGNGTASRKIVKIIERYINNKQLFFKTLDRNLKNF